MSSTESKINKKRGAVSSSPVARKRQRPQDDDASQCSSKTSRQHSHDGQSHACCVASHFSVPLDYIFREVPSTVGPLSLSQTPTKQQRRKTLMTRSEAHCLLCVNQLAHEVDLLTKVALESLACWKQCQSFSEKIQNNANHPILRSVLPLFAIHGKNPAQSALQHLQVELENRILPELSVCASSLRQFSEQNLALSESLLDAFGVDDVASGGTALATPSSGQELANEKRVCGDVQEELCSRIEHFKGMVEQHTCSSEDDCDENFEVSAVDPQRATQHMTSFVEEIEKGLKSQSGTRSSMEDFCNGLLVKESSALYSGVSASTTISAGGREIIQGSTIIPRQPEEAAESFCTPDFKCHIQDSSISSAGSIPHKHGVQKTNAKAPARQIDSPESANTSKKNRGNTTDEPENIQGKENSSLVQLGSKSFEASHSSPSPLEEVNNTLSHLDASSELIGGYGSPPPNSQTAAEALTVLASSV